jgi:hypothetical protein
MDKFKEEMLEVAAKYRGNVLNEVIYLERIIDRYITRHFVGDDPAKEFDLHVAVLGNNRMTLDAKKQVFEYIAAKYDPIFLTKYKSSRIVNPDQKNNKKECKHHNLQSDIAYIITQRNILAHFILDDREEARKRHIDEVTFVRFRDEEKPFDFDIHSYNQLMFVIMDVSMYFLQRIESWDTMRPSNSGSGTTSEPSKEP